MTAHAVTCDADSAGIELLERRKECFWKLFGDVRVHIVALGPWFLGCIDVEAGTRAEIVCFVFTLNL
jgi:hypothetical protein